MSLPTDEPGDKRIRLRNMQLVQLKTPNDYVARSSTTQFVSTNDNIGNYMPVLAIQELLAEETDCWNIHRKIDWDFVNENYSFAVIGGAGLLHKTFSNFWVEFREHCTLPFVIWGVGMCEIDGQQDPTYCSPELVEPVFAKALAINVRDERTAELYAGGVSNVDISACPTVFYLRNFDVNPIANRAALVMHPDLVSKESHLAAKSLLESAGYEVCETENVQTSETGLKDIIQDCYATSSLIVTSRLHGAIAAYALGLPYIAIAGDEKLREFVRLYGRGKLINEISELESALGRVVEVSGKPPIEHFQQFGKRVLDLISTHGKRLQK